MQTYHPPFVLVFFSKDNSQSCLYPSLYNCITLRPACGMMERTVYVYVGEHKLSSMQILFQYKSYRWRKGREQPECKFKSIIWWVSWVCIYFCNIKYKMCYTVYRSCSFAAKSINRNTHYHKFTHLNPNRKSREGLHITFMEKRRKKKDPAELWCACAFYVVYLLDRYHKTPKSRFLRQIGSKGSYGDLDTACCLGDALVL